jgi:hypothetical protein
MSTTVTLNRPTFCSLRWIASFVAESWPTHRSTFASMLPPACVTLISASSASPAAFGILYVALRIGLGLGTLCHFGGTSHASSAAAVSGAGLGFVLAAALGAGVGFGASGGTPEALDPGGSPVLEHPRAKRTIMQARSFIASK